MPRKTVKVHQNVNIGFYVGIEVPSYYNFLLDILPVLLIFKLLKYVSTLKNNKMNIHEHPSNFCVYCWFQFDAF